MRTVILFVLMTIPLFADIIIDNNCAADARCIVTGSVGGVGTTVFSENLVAFGDNGGPQGGGNGPGGSASVTLSETLTTSGPVRSGYIVFSYDACIIQPNIPCYTTGTSSIGTSGALASFAVGNLAGGVPGEVGVPRPIAGELRPFILGVPFEVTASVSFDVPPGSPDNLFEYSGYADINMSFSIYESEVSGYPIDPVIIEDASTTVPEPGYFGPLALCCVLLAAGPCVTHLFRRLHREPCRTCSRDMQFRR